MAGNRHIDTNGIIRSTEEIQNILLKMDEVTRKFENEAIDYNDQISDTIMPKAINLLDEIRESIKKVEDIVNKSSETRKEGAIYLKKSENSLADRIGRI